MYSASYGFYLCYWCSVYFVEEVDELLKIYLVIRFYAGDFDHSIHLFVCYAFSQYLENLLEIFSADISFSTITNKKLRKI